MARSLALPPPEEAGLLAQQWRVLARAATFVAFLTSPAVFVYLHKHQGWSIGWSVVGALVLVAAFRGFIDLVLRRFIPWPSLFGTDDRRMREEDIVNRRRAWFWRGKWRWVRLFLTIVVFVIVYRALIHGWGAANPWHAVKSVLHWPGHIIHSPAARQYLPLAAILPFYFIFNFAILMGPLLLMGISQIRGFEPGDAEWGVKLDDVRGQAEAKEEVRRVVSLWQSGELFEKAGGKRERGLLFLGAPGTGKTMLAKAIATGFNSPFISIPGSGFANTFIGIDAVIVRFLARKAKKLAAKWGGQCIVFIDEIDAVGRRRAGVQGMMPPALADFLFFGENGALNPSGDMLLETRAWRDKLFEQRAPERRSPYPAWATRLSNVVNQAIPGGMMGGGGQLALNQLLITMDGIDNPPFLKRMVTNRVNTLLDASYIVPRRVGPVPLRLPPPRPRGDQIYFIGATNIPIDQLDPALTRPGRLGRHVWFRTPTKQDRLDIFDLYLAKVDHDEELDRPARRDEIARITSGYAQSLDAKLLTPTGWTTMDKIEVGDRVIGAGGGATKVVGVHPRGEMDVFEVRFNDGTRTRCTADHLWTVESQDPRMTPRTFALSEILRRGLLWSPGGSRFYLPKIGPAQFESEAELPLDPYLLGLLLGDGGFTDATPDFCTADEENRAAVEALVPAGVALMRHGPMNWHLSSGSRRGIPRGQANPVTQALRNLHLWGVRGSGKFVPTTYKFASTDTRLAVLQGLMDTDGSRDYRRGNGAEFYSSSRALADDVAFIVRSLGGTARVKAKRAGWRVALDLPDGIVPFRLSRKAADYRVSRKPFRKRIVSVELVGTQPVQCITVDAEDGLYITDGFTVTHNSPAMVEQVCSLALTYSHHQGRGAFEWEDLVEAMTTLESGTAIGIDYVPGETRAVAIHEAGHAVAGHVYLEGRESTRLSIRMRGNALGHHQALDKEERFSRFRTEEIGILIWGLGAMAAEHVFYGENTNGVGGDLFSVTAAAAYMVGASGMGPERVELTGPGKMNGHPRRLTADEQRKEIMRKFEEMGVQIMSRANLEHSPIGGVIADRDKRRLVAQIIGQAYMKAYHLILHNKPQVEHIADVVVEKKELYGDELVRLLNGAQLEIPVVDLTDEKVWPVL
jgi:ATP-dependent Zn protease